MTLLGDIRKARGDRERGDSLEVGVAAAEFELRVEQPRQGVLIGEFVVKLGVRGRAHMDEGQSRAGCGEYGRQGCGVTAPLLAVDPDDHVGIHRLPPRQRAAVSDCGAGGVSDAMLPGVTAKTGQGAR